MRLEAQLGMFGLLVQAKAHFRELLVFKGTDLKEENASQTECKV